MPSDRLSPTTDQESTAAAPTAAAASAGGVKAWLPLLVMILLMPVLAFTMTQFVLLPRLQAGLGITPPAASTSEEGGGKSATGKRESVMMNKLLVNVAGTMGARYLLVSLAAVGTDAKFREKMQEHEPELRDMACGALATKTLADLEKPGARNLIRSELIAGFNNILGGPLVQEIYLTEFAIQ